MSLIRGAGILVQFLMTPRIRIVSCLVWCASWPVLAIILLTPLPFGFVSRTDLLGHFLLFGFMTIFLVLFVRTQAQIIALAVLTMIYSLGLEIAQGYVPNRVFDLADAAANLAGGIAGCLGALFILRTYMQPAERTAAGS